MIRLLSEGQILFLYIFDGLVKVFKVSAQC